MATVGTDYCRSASARNSPAKLAKMAAETGWDGLVHCELLMDARIEMHDGLGEIRGVVNSYGMNTKVADVRSRIKSLYGRRTVRTIQSKDRLATVVTKPKLLEFMNSSSKIRDREGRFLSYGELLGTDMQGKLSVSMDENKTREGLLYFRGCREDELRHLLDKAEETQMGLKYLHAQSGNEMLRLFKDTMMKTEQEFLRGFKNFFDVTIEQETETSGIASGWVDTIHLDTTENAIRVYHGAYNPSKDMSGSIATNGMKKLIFHDGTAHTIVLKGPYGSLKDVTMMGHYTGFPAFEEQNVDWNCEFSGDASYSLTPPMTRENVVKSDSKMKEWQTQLQKLVGTQFRLDSAQAVYECLGVVYSPTQYQYANREQLEKVASQLYSINSSTPRAVLIPFSSDLHTAISKNLGELTKAAENLNIQGTHPAQYIISQFKDMTASKKAYRCSPLTVAMIKKLVA